MERTATKLGDPRAYRSVSRPRGRGSSARRRRLRADGALSARVGASRRAYRLEDRRARGRGQWHRQGLGTAAERKIERCDTVPARCLGFAEHARHIAGYSIFRAFYFRFRRSSSFSSSPFGRGRSAFFFSLRRAAGEPCARILGEGPFLFSSTAPLRLTCDC